MTICYNACEAAMLILITAMIELSLNLIFRQQEGPHYPGVSQRLLKILHTPAALMGTWASDGNYWKYLTQVGTWLTPQFKKCRHQDEYSLFLKDTSDACQPWASLVFFIPVLISTSSSPVLLVPLSCAQDPAAPAAASGHHLLQFRQLLLFLLFL